MKKIIIISTIVLASIFQISKATADLIQEYVLDDSIIYTIPAHPSTTVTIHFPSEIEGLKGVGFTLGGENEPTDFICSYTPGDNYFSMAPTASDVQSRNINVITNGKIYVLKPYLVNEADQACAVVKFKNKSMLTPESDASSTIEKKICVQSDNEIASVNKMLGIIDLLKLIGGLKNETAQSVMNKFPQMEYKEVFGDSLDYGLYSIHLKYVIRNQAIDALGFCFVVENQSNDDLILDPESICVRAGDHVYQQAISDLQPKLKSEESAVGYFVIHRDGEGIKNYLDVNNNFKISLDILSPSKDEIL